MQFFFCKNLCWETINIQNKNTGEKTIVLKTADPGIQTQTNMAELIKWYNLAMEESVWVLPIAVEFIFRFLAIHPFQDGNGRLSRLLFHLVLLNERETYSNIIPLIAIDRQIERTRTQYYSVLRQVSEGQFNINPNKYNYIPFLRYMISMMRESLKNIDFYSGKYEKLNGLSQTNLRILNLFKDRPEETLQTHIIVK